MANQKQNRCVICNEPYEGYGHNALPVKEGRCCTDCNWTGVISARAEKMMHQKLQSIFNRNKKNSNNQTNNTTGDQK